MNLKKYFLFLHSLLVIFAFTTPAFSENAKIEKYKKIRQYLSVLNERAAYHVRIAQMIEEKGYNPYLIRRLRKIQLTKQNLKRWDKILGLWITPNGETEPHQRYVSALHHALGAHEEWRNHFFRLVNAREGLSNYFEEGVIRSGIAFLDKFIKTHRPISTNSENIRKAWKMMVYWRKKVKSLGASKNIVSLLLKRELAAAKNADVLLDNDRKQVWLTYAGTVSLPLPLSKVVSVGRFLGVKGGLMLLGAGCAASTLAGCNDHKRKPIISNSAAVSNDRLIKTGLGITVHMASWIKKEDYNEIGKIIDKYFIDFYAFLGVSVTRETRLQVIIVERIKSFYHPSSPTGCASGSYDPGSDTTRVAWGKDGDLPYPRRTDIFPAFAHELSHRWLRIMGLSDRHEDFPRNVIEADLYAHGNSVNFSGSFDLYDPTTYNPTSCILNKK